MRKIYLVKKNPELPADGNNWLVMNSFEFRNFIQTPEGQKRRDRFGQLDACSVDDVIIIAECGTETAKQWRSEKDRHDYLVSIENQGVKQAFLMEREFQSQAEISSKSRVDGYDDFIFVNRYGDVQNQGNLNKALRRMMRDCNDEILEKYGADSDPVLLPQFSCHILRHTFATRLCESGANLKFIQSILGHADVSTTMNIYVDVTDALKKKEITAFDDYMTTKLET